MNQYTITEASIQMRIWIFILLALPPLSYGADLDKGRSCYKKGDYACALTEWNPLAEQGNGKAQFSIGVMYEFGRGVKQDYVEAASWYRKSAEQGVMEAQFNLGSKYYSGQGVSENKAEAARWYRRAAEQGEQNAQFNLGKCMG